MPQQIEATATSFAAPEVIFKHLCVVEAWGEWGRFLRRARRERPGDEHPNGVGAVRLLPPRREEVVVYDPPRHYGYVVLAGPPPRGYRVDVTLEACGTDTLIRWRGAFDPGLPGSGTVTAAMLRRRLAAYARRVARHSERCEPGCPARLPCPL
ncbi:SRPBCC family protein [Actinomadura roseirufa]|uniref:SRPBCC family protein n=1 Tax=Actinomadura roseirufa TaxID=2094049 RepID=UPI001040E7D9|nr:SRPBCC family protein [Actinomadura roseirufa]